MVGIWVRIAGYDRKAPTKCILAKTASRMDNDWVRMKLWGVRGSTPTPQMENLKFGGNTSCLEIRAGENDPVIFDAGSGIRAVGQMLLEEAGGKPIDATIFLTHFHWDHIQGIPFSAPSTDPQTA